MPKYMRAYAKRDGESKSEAGSPIRFVASTENVARDGLVIEAAGWQLNNYRKNPVFLWAHDYSGARPPIGRAEVSLGDRELLADVTFDQGDEFARDIERKYREGFLSTVSVGWDTLEFAPSKSMNQPPRITKAELLDISAVPVPGDPDALKERQVRALADLSQSLVGIMTKGAEDDDASATWQGAATEMVRLFLDGARRPEADQRALYNAAAARYRKLGKTPPEYRSPADLAGLGPAEVAGLFLEGEAPSISVELLAEMYLGGSRAGAVLNARNRDDLEQAMSLIQGVLDRAKKEEPADEEPRGDVDDHDARAFLEALGQLKI